MSSQERSFAYGLHSGWSGLHTTALFSGLDRLDLCPSQNFLFSRTLQQLLAM
jgi:hypothetical protein